MNTVPPTPQGQEGTWVPVDASSLPFTVGGAPNQPVLGPDGSYYCVARSEQGFAPISANQNNAIPAPSQLVQLPPIVQPIALVPYSSQNQPLVQYNPNYTPEVPLGNTNDPVYREKPYAFLSVLLVLIAVAAAVVCALLVCLSASSGITGIDAVFGLMQKFNIGNFESVYYAEVLAVQGGNTPILATIGGIAIPVIFALSLVLALVLVIKYLSKLGSRKSPRGFSAIALIGLILAAINLVVLFMSESIMDASLTPELGSYILTGAFLLMLIVPYFAKRGAVVVDLEASKRVYNYR